MQLRRGAGPAGATPSLCTGLLPDVLRAFHDRYPGIRLLIEESGSHDLVRELARGALDLALIVLPLPTPAPALTTVELLREDLVVVSSPEAPVPGRDGRAVEIGDLEGERLVMFRHGYDLRELTVAACRSAGFEPDLAVEGGEMDAVPGFVRAGLGVAVVPRMVAARAGRGLRVTPLARPGLHRTIALAHRSDVASPRAAPGVAADAAGAVAGARSAQDGWPQHLLAPPAERRGRVLGRAGRRAAVEALLGRGVHEVGQGLAPSPRSLRAAAVSPCTPRR